MPAQMRAGAMKPPASALAGLTIPKGVSPAFSSPTGFSPSFGEDEAKQAREKTDANEKYDFFLWKQQTLKDELADLKRQFTKSASSLKIQVDGQDQRGIVPMAQDHDPQCHGGEPSQPEPGTQEDIMKRLGLMPLPRISHLVQDSPGESQLGSADEYEDNDRLSSIRPNSPVPANNASPQTNRSSQRGFSPSAVQRVHSEAALIPKAPGNQGMPGLPPLFSSDSDGAQPRGSKFGQRAHTTSPVSNEDQSGGPALPDFPDDFDHIRPSNAGLLDQLLGSKSKSPMGRRARAAFDDSIAG